KTRQKSICAVRAQRDRYLISALGFFDAFSAGNGSAFLLILHLLIFITICTCLLQLPPELLKLFCDLYIIVRNLDFFIEGR
ncbi:MAG TPA: hypothetical protein DCZ76_11355, partial [Treponema sp.]|nr:hypothetical protein [Treponema sp.]